MPSALPRRGLAATLVVLAVAALLALHPAGPVRGASITVTTADDELNSDGDCSLREAIQAANTDAAVDACDPGSGADTISLPAGTYTLTLGPAGDDAGASGDLDVSESVIIQGAGAATTIIQACTFSQVSAPCGTGPGQNGGLGVQDRVFHVLGGTLTLSGVTVRHGHGGSTGGGGLLVESGAGLVLANATVAANVTPGLGGGIHNLGAVIIDRSLLVGNTAGGDGGGLNNQPGGTVTLLNTTVSGNVAVGGSGGGILNGNTVRAAFVTIAGNSASTGGGIRSPGSFEARGVILADNTAGTFGPDCVDAVTSRGYNLVEDLTGCAVTPTTGDVTGQDPLLAPLGANGGPTETHALLAGSPAVEAVPAADCEDLDGNAVTADQRGVARPQGAACDVGAYEADNVAQLTVTRGGSGSGTVTSDDGGIVCGTACTRFYIAGDTVTLTAAPGAGSVFTGWSGGCTANATTTTVIVLDDTTCTATFGLAPPPTPTPTPTPTPPSTPTPTPTPLPDGIRLPETGSGGDAAGK